jgi:transcriptional regulator with XRE-family HTH domain
MILENKEIAERLKSARKAMGYPSARNFAKFHKIPESTYSQHESGKRLLNLKTLFNYSYLLSINHEWLLTGKGEFLSQINKEDNVFSKKRVLKPISKDTCSYVNVTLLSEIFMETIPHIDKNKIQSEYNTIVNYCYTVYNNLFLSSANKKTKKTMIQLAALSLHNGLENILKKNRPTLVKNEST